MHVRPRYEGVHTLPVFLAAMVLVVAVITGLSLTGSTSAGAQAEQRQGTKPAPQHKDSPLSNQVIGGFPLTITVQDNTRMMIDSRDLGDQFFDGDAEGLSLWVNGGGTPKVFGPGTVPAGNPTFPYAPV